MTAKHLTFETLTEAHDLTGFASGEASIDAFLHQRAIAYQKADQARITVAMEGDGRVVAFYCLSMSCIWPDDLPKKDRMGNLRMAVPAVLIGQMGVDKAHQGSGFGSLVLAHALRSCIQSAEIAAARIVFLDALKPELVAWYERFGFKPTLTNPLRLYSRMKWIRNTFGNTNL